MNYANERVKKLIEKLQEEHILYNQSFETDEKYYEFGEEDFKCWLNKVINEVLGNEN